MTENPDDIRREIEIAGIAFNLSQTIAREYVRTNGPGPGEVAGNLLASATIAEFARHLFQLHIRLARAEADATNNAQRKP